MNLNALQELKIKLKETQDLIDLVLDGEQPKAEPEPEITFYVAESYATYIGFLRERGLDPSAWNNIYVDNANVLMGRSKPSVILIGNVQRHKDYDKIMEIAHFYNANIVHFK